jgi:hypothetical protein
MTEDTRRSVYELVQMLSSFNETRRAIIMALAHVYPKSVSGVQLSRLIGYSGKSRSLYRGVLAYLQDDKLIHIDELTPKLYAIRINSEHPLLGVLIGLCKEYGTEARAIYAKAMEEQ